MSRVRRGPSSWTPQVADSNCGASTGALFFCPAPASTRIAVLPFKPIVAENRNEALELGMSDARQYYAHLLSNTGRHAEAMSEIGKALEVEPLSLRANSLRGVFLNNEGRFDEGIAQFRKALDLQRDFRVAQTFLSRALYEKGLRLAGRIENKMILAARTKSGVMYQAEDVRTRPARGVEIPAA
jgi:tetratricopeptide (TPR) repeat protein